MNCAPFDLRDYYFEAIGADERRQMSEHVRGCELCAGELERLRRTALTLGALPDEEIPRRIAFVSDKVFEPSPARRFWQALWLSGARMGALAAALLAVAILVHAFRPVPSAPAVAIPASAVRVAAADPAVIQAAVDRAVAKAVAAQEARYDLKLQQVAFENRKQERATMERVAEVFDAMDRQNRVNVVASNRLLETGQ